MFLHPRLLPELLIPGTAVIVRYPNAPPSQVSYIEALGLAELGAVEGVVSPTGKLRFLRMVEQRFDMRAFTTALRAGAGTLEPERAETGHSGANIGVFDQPLGSEESGWSGFTYKFCLSDRDL